MVDEPVVQYSVSTGVNLPDWPYKQIEVSSEDLMMFRLNTENPNFITLTLTYTKKKKHATYSWDISCCSSVYLYIAEGKVPTFLIYYPASSDCPCFTEFGNL